MNYSLYVKTIMKHLLPGSFVLTFLIALSPPCLGADFRVSPSGSDEAPGTAEKPFRTLERARQAVRTWRAQHPDEAVTVTFQPGTYELERTVEFEPEDSGASAEKPVVYQAAAGGEVVISGGRRITGWESSNRIVWKAKVSPTDWRFTQLWVGGQRAIRARTPNYWQFATLDSVTEEPAAAGRVKHTFTTRPEALRQLEGLDPAQLTNVEVVVFHRWDTTREHIATVSPDQGVFTTFGKPMQGWNRMERDCLFYLENLLPAADAPREWYLGLDGWLYYLAESRSYPRQIGSGGAGGGAVSGVQRGGWCSRAGRCKTSSFADSSSGTAS